MNYKDILKSKFYEESYKWIENAKKDFPVDHAFKHVNNVLNYTKNLAEIFNLSDKEKELLFISAVLHDVGYLDVTKEHAISGAEIVRTFLTENNFDKNGIDIICNAIKNHGGKTKESFINKVSFCLALADKLDFTKDRYGEKIANFTNGENFLEIIKNEVSFNKNMLIIKTSVTPKFNEDSIKQDYFHTKFLQLLKLISETLGYETAWEITVI